MSLSFSSSSTKHRSAWHIVGQHCILGESIQDAESALESTRKTASKCACSNLDDREGPWTTT